jgi:hypothetical protein
MLACDMRSAHADSCTELYAGCVHVLLCALYHCSVWADMDTIKIDMNEVSTVALHVFIRDILSLPLNNLLSLRCC